MYDSGKVYFTIKRMHNITKVTAIHEESTVEVTLALPSSLSIEDMKTMAFKRLIYVLKKGKR